MRAGDLFQELRVPVTFTPEEIRVLHECSKCHYDSKVKRLFKRGGLGCKIEVNQGYVEVSRREVDHLNKCLAMIRHTTPELQTTAYALREDIHLLLVRMTKCQATP